MVLAFPCNQFGGQEPGSPDEIRKFVSGYGVTFPVFGKIDVNGPSADPLYQWLVKEAPGILGTKSIKWNFTKFLVGRDGHVLGRYAPTDTPKGLNDDVARALAQPEA